MRVEPELAREVARRFGRHHCVLVGSGTTALYCAFARLRRQRADVVSPAVLFPNVTCETAVNAAVFAGLTPRFCDVRRDDWVLSAESARRTLGEADLLGIVPTHIYGHLADIPALERMCGKAVVVIEDAAQGYGGRLDGRPAGSMGSVSVVSFGAGKLLDCGGGGALLCDDAADARAFEEIAAGLPVDEGGWPTHREQVMRKMVAARRELRDDRAGLIRRQLEILREHRHGYLAQLVPARADAIRAALPGLEAAVREREELTARLDEILARSSLVTLPRRAGRSVLWRYSFLVEAHARDAKAEELAAAGLIVSKLFPPCTEKFAPVRPALPVSEQLAASIVNLQFPAARVTPSDVVDACKRVFN